MFDFLSCDNANKLSGCKTIFKRMSQMQVLLETDVEIADEEIKQLVF